MKIGDTVETPSGRGTVDSFEVWGTGRFPQIVTDDSKLSHLKSRGKHHVRTGVKINGNTAFFPLSELRSLNGDY